MTTLFNFLTSHEGVIAMGLAWSVREWTTVKGLRGLKNFFLTGSIAETRQSLDPLSKTNAEIKTN